MFRRALVALWGTGVGAGLMFYGDPRLGRRRRAQLKGRMVHSFRQMFRSTGRATRDLSHRSHGLVQRRLGRAGEQWADDATLEARARAALGRCCSHPGAIQIQAHEGVLELSGVVFDDEHDLLVRRLQLVNGVNEVISHLQRHDTATHHPALQGPRREIRGHRAHWTPATRLLAGTGSALAIGYGLKEHGPKRWAALSFGKILGLRAWTNLDLRHLFGIGGDRRVIDLHKDLFVAAPVSEVFAFWNAFENFPRFMSHVRAIERLSDDRYLWKVDGPLGLPMEWEAEVTRRLPDELLSWRTSEGAHVRHTGVIRFERIGDTGTRLDIRLSYNPPAGALGHFAAKLFKVDPKSQMDDDLQRFKSLLERGKATGRRETVYRDEIAIPNMDQPPLRH